METSRMTDLDALELACTVAQVADAQHGSDIVVLDVGDVLGITEYFVVVGASNRRLVRTLVDEIEVHTRERTGRSPRRVEGVREQQWVLVDYGDVVVHVFLGEVRDFYEIERLYKDVPSVAWQVER
jgi:ribosome-associated protein